VCIGHERSDDRLRVRHQTRIVRPMRIHYSRDINSTTTATKEEDEPSTDGDNKGTFGWPLSSWLVGVARAEAVRVHGLAKYPPRPFIDRRYGIPMSALSPVLNVQLDL